MKFSDAMMLGSLAIQARPHARCSLYPQDPKSGCALGMAEFSIGRYGSMCAAEKEWKWLNNPYDASLFPCGCCISTLHPTYTTVIAQMFNRHVMGKGDWTLEKLADYVRSIEPAEESTLPDLPLSEQLRLEEEAAAEEGAAIEASNLPYPEYERNGRY